MKVISFCMPALLAFGLFGAAYARVDSTPTPARDEETANQFPTREPVYQSKGPKYCLLTFGRESKTRVWLVFDSVPDPLRPGINKDYLYVDRNGNGDLTEVGERVAATILKRQIRSSIVPSGFYDEPLLEFPIGELKDSEGAIYKDIKVMVQWFVGRERPCTIYASAAAGGTQRTEFHGLIFAGRPQEAPVLRFGGRLTMRFALGEIQSLSLSEECNLQAEVGSIGSGPSSFVFMLNDKFPKDLHPVAEIEWPHRDSGNPPIKTSVTLNQRC
jgi:hypothetical protein